MIVTCDSFKVRRHIIAVIFGIVPAIAAFHSQGSNSNSTDQYAVLSHGYMLLSMIFAATAAYIIDRRFVHATFWLCGAALAAVAKLIHVENSQDCIVGYLTSASICAVWAFAQWYRGEREVDFETHSDEFHLSNGDIINQHMGKERKSIEEKVSSVPTTPVFTPLNSPGSGFVSDENNTELKDESCTDLNFPNKYGSLGVSC